MKTITLSQWKSLEAQKQKLSQLQTFKVPLNPKKLVIGGTLIAACLATLGTNWMIPFIVPYALNMPVDYDKFMIKIRRIKSRLFPLR